jgi:hypothetical protein
MYSNACPKRWHPFTKLHGGTFLKEVIFKALVIDFKVTKVIGLRES